MATGYKMDHALLMSRAKTIRELKPNYWWDADHGITLDSDRVASWVDRVAGLELAQADDAKQPTWAKYGLSQRSCLIFDGRDVLFNATCPMAAWTKHTVLVQYQMLGVVPDPAASQAFLAASQASDPVDSYLFFGVSSLNVQMTLFRNDAAAVFARGATDVNTTAGRRVGCFTQNAALDKWVQYLDGVSEVLGPGTDAGKSFSGVTGMDVFSVGAQSADGVGLGTPLYGKIAQIIMWDELL